MGSMLGGIATRRSPQLSKSFAAGTASSTDLTLAAHSSAERAADGLLCFVTATTIRLTYEDSAGTSVDTGSITSVVGNTFKVDGAVSELTTNTGLVVIAFWSK